MSGTSNEEALKKNTDCVYFLASPLTCKKGNECEFRHSESARNNPRDCWYWLSGACLNANCAFRHPRLDTLPEGEQVAAGKSRVPCYYFLQGYCMKGDKCMFMHGLPTASSAAEKTLKPSAAKTCGDVLDNQNSANKGNGSVTSKACLDYCEAPLAQNEAREPDATATNRLPEGSDSSAAARSRPLQHSERSKQDSAINGRLHQQVHPSDNEFLHHEPQTEDEPLCDFHPGDDGLGQDPSGEDGAHNGTESEELWEESSFDVLVDDGGTDQLIYADDLDYLNQYDAIVDHLTAGHIQAGIRGADGFVDFEYDHTGAYTQYYDAEYELATYEQQLVYENLSSFDAEDGLPPFLPLNSRQTNRRHPHHRRDGPFDGEVRPANVGSNDLRNHISKRRRAEKNQEDYHRKRHQGSNGSQHNRRHLEGHSKQHDRLLARRHISPQTGSRSNRQYHGRGNSSGGRQLHGRLVDPFGTTRAYRDAASGHEELGVDQTLGRKFWGMNDNFKAKGKPERERGRPAAYDADDSLGSRARPATYGTDDGLGSRGHQHSKKAEGHKEDSSFTGPKSLAQIKAEKMKAIGLGGLSQQPESRGELDGGVLKRQVKVLQCCRTEAPLKEPGNASIGKESDFEGPKPLSVILKQKRREDGNGEARQQRLEKGFRGEGNGATGDSASMFAGTRDSSKYAPSSAADLSAVPEYKRNSVRGAEQAEHGVRARGESGLHWQQEAASVPTSSRGNESELGDLHANRLDKGVVPARDAENGLDMGDSLIEDGEYEDDDDEDDFAKKLGGFFS